MQRLHTFLVFSIGAILLSLGAFAEDPPKPPAETPAAPSPSEHQGFATSDSPAGETLAPEPGAAPTEEIQERGLPLKGLSDSRAPAPSGMASQPGFVGATDNITRVGRAIQVRAKSLTMLVTVGAGVSVTQPVTISIALGGYGPTRQTQSYVPSTGNRFLYNDPEGDGKPRRAFADITLTEPKPGGGVYTSTIPGSVMLDPLYDVTIGPLSFTLFTNCARFGDSDIKLAWTSPDESQKGFSFKTKAGKHVTVSGFAWSRAEVSGSAKLVPPRMSFHGGKFWPCFPGSCFTPGTYGGSSPPPNLVPGKTRQVVTSLKEVSHGKCTASSQYDITYKLRWYPYL